MKKEIIIVIIVLLLIAGAVTFLIFRKEPEKKENNVEEVEAVVEEEHSEIDLDVDLDLESVPLDLADNEKEEFNEIFDEYDKKTLDSKKAKELIDLVIDTNKKFQGDGKRFVSIDDKDYFNLDNKLYMRCLDANPYYGGDNTKEDVADAIKEMESFKDSLKDDASYKISLIKGRGIVIEISIVEK